MLPLLVDGLIVVLLLVVLGRGVRLQRNLRDLRSGDGEIERLIARSTAPARAPRPLSTVSGRPPGPPASAWTASSRARSGWSTTCSS